MKQFLATGLLLSVFGGIAVMWSPGHWAVSVPQTAVFLLALIWSPYTVFHRRAVPFRFPILPLLGILVYGALQLGLHWTVYAWETQESLLYWFANLVVLVVATDLSRDPIIRFRLLNWLFLGGVAVAILSVVQVFTSDGNVFWIFAAPYRDDVYGPFVYKNQYAAFLELLLPIALVRAMGTDHTRGRYIVISAVLYACAVASNSRAGLVLCSAEVLIVSAILLWKKDLAFAKMRKLATAFGLTAGLFVAVIGPETAWNRLQQHDPYSSRRPLLISSIAMFRDRPVKGFGWGTWATAYPAYAVEDDGLFANQAHNDWAQAAVEGGIPGLLCFGALFVWSLGAGWRTVWGMGICFVLVHAWVDYPIQRQALAECFFLLAGIQAGTLGLKFPSAFSDL